MSTVTDYGKKPPLIKRDRSRKAKHPHSMNCQDFEQQVAEPLTLASGNIETSLANLETAATALDKANERHAAWFVRRALWKLRQALEVVGVKA